MNGTVPCPMGAAPEGTAVGRGRGPFARPGLITPASLTSDFAPLPLVIWRPRTAM